jgi:hypothetical protein
MKQRLLQSYFKKTDTPVVPSIEVPASQILEHLPPSKQLTKRKAVEILKGLPEETGRASKYNKVDKKDKLKVVKTMLSEKWSANKAVERFCALSVTERSVKNWRQKFQNLKKKYLAQGLDEKEATGKADAEFLDEPKRGRSTLLPPAMHDQLLKLICAINACDGRISALIVLAMAKSVVQSNGKGDELYENGGTLLLKERWQDRSCKIHLVGLRERQQLIES